MSNILKGLKQINENFGPAATAAIQQGRDPGTVAFAALDDKILGYGPNQQTDEGEEMSTFAALKDWRVWDVHVYNNFYRGKYADYGPRLYSVVASSPEEARQVVIDNPDYVLQDLLSRKLQSGKRVLPRGSALPIEAKRVGKADPGTITTMAFKKMLTPDGVQSFKFTNGKIVDGAHVQGGEEQNMTEGQDIDVNVVVGKLYDIIDHAEDSIKNADYDRQAQYATTVRDRAVKALNMIKHGGNTPEAASAAFRYFQTGEQGVAEGLDHSKRQQLIKFLVKKLGWEHSYLELASDANLISWYKKVQAGKNPMGNKELDENSMADFFANKAKELYPNATIRKNGETLQEPPKFAEPPKAPEAPVDVAQLEKQYAELEKRYEQLGGDSWQYADRMMDRDYEAQSVGRQLRVLASQIAKAKNPILKGISESRKMSAAEKLQRAFQQEQEKSKREREVGQRYMNSLSPKKDEKKDDKEKTDESFGNNYPQTYEEENDPFKKKGNQRPTDLTT